VVFPFTKWVPFQQIAIQSGATSMHLIEASRRKWRLQASSWARRLSSSRCAWSPKKSPVTFPRSVRSPEAHPRRLADLFGEVHDPRLRPEGLVETVGDLAEVMGHGRLLLDNPGVGVDSLVSISSAARGRRRCPWIGARGSPSTPTLTDVVSGGARVCGEARPWRSSSRWPDSKICRLGPG
jgi:hypothetical protein